jgi:NDP-sugar pyrophosphorylase family protein
MILAGGLGTRLRSVVSDRPKVLAEVLGRPFLAYLLDQLAASGINRVILCIGYLGEQVIATFGENYGEMKIFYSRETQLLGTGGALRLALPLVQSSQVMVLNGDSFCEAALDQFHQFHLEQATPVSMILTQVADTARYGRVELSPTGRVEKFIEKRQNQGSGWINGGIYLMETELLATIPPTQPVSLEADLFPQWIDRGLSGYCSQGKFLDIGTPESYPLARELFS